MPFPSSVRWRLLVAFLGISSFAVFGGAVAIYAFLQIETVLERITERSVPSVLTSLRLSRQAERLVAAAPTLLSAKTLAQHDESARRIRTETAQLNAILDTLKQRDIDPALIEPLEFAVNWLTLNLISLETTVGNALAIGEQRRTLGREALAATTDMRVLLQPALNDLDDRIATTPKTGSGADAGSNAGAEDLADSLAMIASSWPLMRMRSELVALGDGLAAIASIDEQEPLQARGRQLGQSLDRIEALAIPLDTALRTAVTDHAARFRALLDTTRWSARPSSLSSQTTAMT